MKKIRIAINGFGRIGRVALRKFMERPCVEVVAINDLAEVDNLAHLLRYDSIHGSFPVEVEASKNQLIVDGKTIRVFQQAQPDLLPWKDMEVDVVVEATGHFTDRKGAQKHLMAGAGQVVLTAPSKNDEDHIPHLVLGVNDQYFDFSAPIISNASCTTNNVAPLIKVLDDNWGIEKAFITTVHSYTKDQNLVDGPHKDWRRGRAAAYSIVPTTTGAAKAATRIFPHLENNLGGAGIRVPVPDGSLTDVTCTLRKPASIETINQSFLKASAGSMKGILEYQTAPIVSSDIIGNTHSAVFDSLLTAVLGDQHKLVKVVAWYDNEMGYSSRLADLLERIQSSKYHTTADEVN